MDYYNQLNSQQNLTAKRSRDAFALASAIFGFISIIGCCTGFISLIAGSMGILFYMLSYRKKREINIWAVVGLILSIIGLTLGIFILVYSIFGVLIPIMTDPAAYEYWDNIYRDMYGMGIADMLQLQQ